MSVIVNNFNADPYMHFFNHRFKLDFKRGSDAEIAFHFNVRFVHGQDRNEVVRNHYTDGQWGPEERTKPHFPFIPNANFELIILCDQESFKVCLLYDNPRKTVDIHYYTRPFISKKSVQMIKKQNRESTKGYSR